MKDLNLHVKQGQKVAIVGPTGCGKTTLINLLMRFYDIDAGKIYVSGHDVKEITKDSLRANFGMVLQDTWLKSGTIAENIDSMKPKLREQRLLRLQRQRMHMDLSSACPMGTIQSSRKMEGICHRDRNSFCVLPE